MHRMPVIQPDLDHIVNRLDIEESVLMAKCDRFQEYSTATTNSLLSPFLGGIFTHPDLLGRLNDLLNLLFSTRFGRPVSISRITTRRLLFDNFRCDILDLLLWSEGGVACGCPSLSSSRSLSHPLDLVINPDPHL